MPKIIPHHLTFRSGLHIGARGLDLEDARPTIPADTLFAALVSAWRLAGQSPDAFVAPFVAEPPDPPFLITSAFPFAGDVRFFPAPPDLAMRFDGESVKSRQKAINRIDWLSEALFLKLLAGEPLDGWLFPENEYEPPTTGVALQGGALWLTREEAQRLPSAMIDKIKRHGKLHLHALRRHSVWRMERVPRVAVERVTDASNLFHAGRTTFARGCGLWFGVQWLRPDDRAGSIRYGDAFDLLLGVLADNGLGGERTYGYGAFTSEEKAAGHWPDPEPGRPALILSRYHPRQDELPEALRGTGAAYHLESVAGWLGSPDGAARRRKRLHLLSEGSLITWPGNPAGDVTDVNPTYENPRGDLPHPVWRYGLALAAGVKEATDA